MKITKKVVADALGGLPPQKMHCSNLASDALRMAIADYLKKKGEVERAKKLGLEKELKMLEEGWKEDEESCEIEEL